MLLKRRRDKGELLGPQGIAERELIVVVRRPLRYVYKVETL